MLLVVFRGFIHFVAYGYVCLVVCLHVCVRAYVRVCVLACVGVTVYASTYYLFIHECYEWYIELVQLNRVVEIILEATFEVRPFLPL